MNEALELYKDDERIFSISAFSLPDFKIANFYGKDVYLWGRFSTWGMATWKEKWNNVHWNIDKYNNYHRFIKDKDAIKKFKSVNPETYNILRDEFEGWLQAWDVKICFHLFLKNMYSVYPVHGVTVNRTPAMKGSGTTTGGGSYSKSFHEQELLRGNKPNLYNDLQPNKKVNDYLYNYFYSFSKHVVVPFFM